MHTYKPDVDRNFLSLTWFNHIIHDSSEPGGQDVGLHPYFSIWSPNIIVMGSVDEPKLGNIF